MISVRRLCFTAGQVAKSESVSYDLGHSETARRIMKAITDAKPGFTTADLRALDTSQLVEAKLLEIYSDHEIHEAIQRKLDALDRERAALAARLTRTTA